MKVIHDEVISLRLRMARTQQEVTKQQKSRGVESSSDVSQIAATPQENTSKTSGRTGSHHRLPATGEHLEKPGF